MSDKNFISKNAVYIESLIGFINDVKPYRCKLTSIIEENQLTESVDVKLTEQLFIKTKTSPTWVYNYFSGANPLFRTFRAQRLVQPSFIKQTFAAGQAEVTDLTNVPYVYSKKSFDGPGVSSVWVHRASGAIEPLTESVDYFQSHGSLQFQIKQTTNANGEFDPTWSSTADDGVVAAASTHTRALALDSTNPTSSISRIKKLLDEIKSAAENVSDPIDLGVQGELNALYAIIAQPEIPRSYEALLTYISIANPPIVPYIRTNPDGSITTVDPQKLEQEFSNLVSPLFFGGYTDIGMRQSGKAVYSAVLSQYINITNIVPNTSTDFEEWTLTAVDDDTYRVSGSTTGFIGFTTAGESFNSNRISFQTEFVAPAPPDAQVSFAPSNKIVIGHNAPLETWNIIKVNPLAHDRPAFTSTGFGNLQDLNGTLDQVSLLDESLPTTDIILTSRVGGQLFDLTSTADPTHTGVAQVGVAYNDGKVGFKLQAGSTPFQQGDRFFIGVKNLPAQAEEIDLGYGYDLDPFDNDNLSYNNTDPSNLHYNRKIGFYYDGRFTDYDLSQLNIQVAQSAVNGRKWRVKAVPTGAPIATLKKDGSGPSYSVDLTDATSGITPDPALNSVPVYSMPGDANPAPDINLFYTTEFDVQFSDDNFNTLTSIGSISVGGTFQSILHGIEFTLPAASRPFIAASSDEGEEPRVEGGDVFSFTVHNPKPVLTEVPITLTSSAAPRLIMHSDSFYAAPAAKWTISFTSPAQYIISAVQPNGNTLPGTPLTCFILTNGIDPKEGLSFKGLGVHFTIVGDSFKAGDKFTFNTFAEKPLYLVHGSVTGWTSPALVGSYYWNGYIGFNLAAPNWNVYLNNDKVEPEAVGLIVHRVQEDAPSLTYIFTATTGGYVVTRTDHGVFDFIAVNNGAGSFSDRYISIGLNGATEPEFKLDVNAHDYTLWNSADVVILNPTVKGRLPAPGDAVVVEKTENGRLDAALSPGAADISALHPITIDQRFIDTNTHQAVPLSSTSPETALLQGWLPLIAEPRDSSTSVAEFSDVATSFAFRSAASAMVIGSLKQQDPIGLNEPINFEWDSDFFTTYLPLNAEANVVISGTGWMDKLRAHVTESVKFMIGPGALFEDWLFRDDLSIAVNDAAEINLLTSANADFDVTVQDSPFIGFQPGYGNTLYDEVEGFDPGQPPDLLSLLAKANLTPQEQQDVLDRWDNFLLDNAVPTTVEQWAFIAAALTEDLNPNGATTDFGLPLKGVVFDSTSSPSADSSTAVKEVLTITINEQSDLLDISLHDVSSLDGVKDKTALIYVNELPPIPSAVLTDATYESFDTSLFVSSPARVFEIIFDVNPAALVTMTPYFSVWLPTEPTPLPVPVVEKLTPGHYRFSIGQASEAKIIVTTEAPAPAPASSEYVLDTFTGTNAPLSAHVGEIGAVWSATTIGDYGVSTGETPLSVDDYELDGNGNLKTIPPFQVALIRPSGALDVVEDHRIEVDFSFSAEATPYMGFQAHGLATYIIGFIADSDLGGHLEINLTGYDENGVFHSLDSPFFFDAVPLNVLHTLRVDIVGAVKTFFLNDVQIMQVTDATVSNHGFPWMMLYDSSAFTVSRFSVTAI